MDKGFSRQIGTSFAGSIARCPRRRRNLCKVDCPRLSKGYYAFLSPVPISSSNRRVLSKRSSVRPFHLDDRRKIELFLFCSWGTKQARIYRFAGLTFVHTSSMLVTLTYRTTCHSGPSSSICPVLHASQPCCTGPLCASMKLPSRSCIRSITANSQGVDFPCCSCIPAVYQTG